MVFFSHDPTEVPIKKKMIDASQRMLKINSQGELGGRMSPPLKRHLELQIKTLQTAPRGAAEQRHWLGKGAGGI